MDDTQHLCCDVVIYLGSLIIQDSDHCASVYAMGNCSPLSTLLQDDNYEPPPIYVVIITLQTNKKRRKDGIMLKGK